MPYLNEDQIGWIPVIGIVAMIIAGLGLAGIIVSLFHIMFAIGLPFLIVILVYGIITKPNDGSDEE